MSRAPPAALFATVLATVLLAGPPAARAETVLTVAAAAFPPEWGNPFASTSITRLPLAAAVFDPLTLVTADGALLPWLAESWQQTGPTGWRLTLREGIKYSDGEAFDAEAVVAAIAYVTGPAAAREPVARELTEVAGARALDARTVEIVTRVPDPLLPRRLSLIHPPAPGAWLRLGRDGFARAPVGTGPYRLLESTPNRLRLKAVAGAWRRAPTDRLEFLALPEPSARRAALTTGAVDLAPSSISADQFVELAAEGGQVIVDRVPAVVALAFNTVKDPRFRDARVRRALTMAVNREAIVAALLGGKTRVAAQPAPFGTFGFNETLEPLPYDPDAARALLAEAGHAGLAFEMEVPTGAVLYPDVFQQVASDLARIGVRMTVNVIAQQTLLERIQSGGWTGAAAAIPFFTPIADALYPMRQHSCLWHAPWYCDEDATVAIAAALAEADPDARRILTERVMARAHDDAQALFLYETAAFMGAGPRIAQVPIDFGFIRYEGIRFTALGPAPAVGH